MRLETAWSSLSPGTVLVAEGTPLPPGWRVEVEPVAAGWTRLATVFNSVQREKDLGTAGWNFFYTAGAIMTSGFGFSRSNMVDSALKHLIDVARLQRCNCIEIDSMAMRSFLRIPYVSLSAHSRHIQKGAFYKATEAIVPQVAQ